MKKDGNVFLPVCIATWGGINAWSSGDRSKLKLNQPKYPTYYDRGFCSFVCSWVANRLARDGIHSVQSVNSILYMVCRRYSGRPEKTYEANYIRGIGSVVRHAKGYAKASQTYMDITRAVQQETSVAVKALRSFSYIGSREYGDKRHLFPDEVWANAEKCGAYSPCIKCAFCSKRAVRSVSMYDNGLILAGISELHGKFNRVDACLPCSLRLGKISKHSLAVDEARRTINATKRKIRESSKVNVRTDGGPVLHHGGGDQRGCERVGGADCVERGDSDHRSGASGNAGSRAGLCDEADAAVFAAAQRPDLAEAAATRAS